MKYEKSCGTIICNGDKVLLIASLTGDWGFPKGHTMPGETEEETALRETKEETNLDVIIDSKKRFKITYSPKEGVLKDVIYFKASLKTNDIKLQVSEISKYEWVNKEEVSKYLKYPEAKEMWQKIKNNL